MDSKKKVVLIIMDGWGHGNKDKSDVIANAKTPFIDSLYEKHPHSQLLTDGENVGLPDGQMGNSEVGHLNIGAGRIVYQDLVKINKAIEDKSIDSNPVLIKAFNYAKQNGVNVHFMGLVSDGGIHSSQEHLHKLCDMAKDNGLSNVYIHAFTDGRDTDPHSGINYLTQLENHLSPALSKGEGVPARGISLPEEEVRGGVNPRFYTTDKLNWCTSIVNAKNHRKNPTEAEWIIWQRLRAKQLRYKFRRQHPVYKYIVDFVCIEKKLVIEIDGKLHEYQKREDEERTFELNQKGFRVIRFKNEEIIAGPDGVIRKIEMELSKVNLPPQVPPERKEDIARGRSLPPACRQARFGEGRGGVIASVVGRYYAMDRDNRWERIKLAYDMLLKGEGRKTTNVLDAIKASYDTGVTDEFIKPIVRVDENNNPIGRIKEGDVVICFNFRTDRCRQITTALTQRDLPEHDMQKMNLHYVTMANYDNTFKDIKVVFEKEDVEMTLGEVLAKAGKKQVRISETEKYPHVTFFFSGGREKPFEGERRIMIPSPMVATYDLKPEMSAYEVTEAITEELQKGEADFICLNFANSDMVGHTGVYEAVVKAVETVDACVKRVVETGIENGYSFIIIADHGNADYIINEDGSPNTAHTTNPVPCILIDANYKQVKDGILADLAPTILTLMGMEIPEEMSGNVIIS